MLLKHRPPDIDSSPVTLHQGFSHLDQGWLAVIRWLNANKVDFVLIGSAALAIRGDASARGPVAIVPAPYGRNFDRLATALVAQHAGAAIRPRGRLRPRGPGARQAERGQARPRSPVAAAVRRLRPRHRGRRQERRGTARGRRRGGARRAIRSCCTSPTGLS